jgi:hypothetical protein
MSANDRQINGTHYQGSVQTWDYILAHDLGFLEGNVIKYVTRFRKKNGIQDLEKARHYLDKLIESEQSANPSATDTHSCSLFCDEPACIKSQRDELRESLFEREWQTLTVDELERLTEKYVDNDGAVDSFDLDILLEEFETMLKGKNAWVVTTTNSKKPSTTTGAKRKPTKSL